MKGTDVATWTSIMSQRSIPHLQRGELLTDVSTHTDYTRGIYTKILFLRISAVVLCLLVCF